MIGNVIAPPALIAVYSCTAYAEAVFMPKIERYAQKIKEEKKDKRTQIIKLTANYDEILNGMCQETTVVFLHHREQVLDVYARQLRDAPASFAALLATPQASRWGSESAALLIKTAPLLQYYALVKSIAPELLKPQQPHYDSTTDEEIRSSVGMTAQAERAILVELLADEGFRVLTPPRFNQKSLLDHEMQFRKQALALKQTSLYWFNDNASELTRMHYGEFEVIKQLGLAEIYLKFGQKLDDLLTQH
jgi:hypothetical protein